MPALLGKNDQFTTFMTPQGPIQVANSAVPQDMMMSPAPQAPAPMVEPNLAGSPWAAPVQAQPMALEPSLAGAFGNAPSPQQQAMQPSPAISQEVPPQGAQEDLGSLQGFTTGQEAPSEMDQLAMAQMSQGVEPSAYQKQLDQSLREMNRIGAQDASYIQGYEKEILKNQAESQLRQQDISNQINSAMSEYQTAVGELTKGSQLDPNRFMRNLSTPSKIVAAISIGLGALGSAMQGRSENQALKIINDSIDKDILAQRAQMDEKRQNVGLKGNMIKMLQERLGDEVSANNAFKSSMLDLAGLQLRKQAQQIDNVEAKNRALTMAGQLEMESQKVRDSQLQRAQALLIKKQLQTGQLQDIELLPEKDQERAVRVGGGFTLAKDKGAADKALALLESTKNSIDLANRLENMVDFRVLPSKEKAAAESVANQLSLVLKNVYQLGVLSESDRKLLDSIIGNPNSVFSGQQKERLKQLKQTILKQEQKAIQTYLPSYKPTQTQRF